MVGEISVQPVDNVEIDVVKVAKIANLLGLTKDEVYSVLKPDDWPGKIKGATASTDICGFFDDIPKGSKFQDLARDKWDSLSMKEFKRAHGFNKLLNVWGASRDGSESFRLLFMELLPLCTSLDKCYEVFRRVPEGSNEEYQILKVWSDLAIKEIKKASKIQTLLNIHEDSPENSEARSLIAKRLYEMIKL
jgi:hypothetical protein